ncbi:MAG: DUF2769 domain-containing protein [Candidatus Thorarchaeota archaeon]
MSDPIEKWPTASFEEKYKMMMGNLSDADQKRSVDQLNDFCQCSKCPTYAGVGDTHRVFCAVGKSEVIHEQKGCLCSTCAATQTMSLRWDYYCTRGSAVNLSEL